MLSLSYRTKAASATSNACRMRPAVAATHHAGRRHTRSCNALQPTKSRAAQPSTGALSPANLISELQGNIQAAAAKLTAQTSEQHSGPKPSLSLRPITTHVNVLITGSIHHVGKVPYYKLTTKATKDGASKESDQAADIPDPHGCFSKDPSPWASALEPVLLPEACREMVYTFQDTPGQGAALDPRLHLECLLSYVLGQQAKDYKQLGGCRGIHKSIACGCLEHSPTVCIYHLPPEGPSRVDLVMLSALSQHVAVLPVICASGLTEAEGQAAQKLVADLLAEAGKYVEGAGSIEMFKPPKADDGPCDMPLLLQGDTPLEIIVKWLMTDPVYDMLDHAWEKYNRFCEGYEQKGKQVKDLAADHVATIRRLGSLDSLSQKRSRLLAVLGKVAQDFAQRHRSTDYILDANFALKDCPEFFEECGFDVVRDVAWIKKNWLRG